MSEVLSKNGHTREMLESGIAHCESSISRLRKKIADKESVIRAYRREIATIPRDPMSAESRFSGYNNHRMVRR
jgi:hypothetical protein